MLAIIFVLASCENLPTSSLQNSRSDEPPDSVTVIWEVCRCAVSPVRSVDGCLYWETVSGYVYARKALENLEPPSQVRVSDIPDDNGHYLGLTWALSPSETDGVVEWYRVYRSRSSILTEPVLLSRFTSVDSLNSWDAHYTVLVDSVAGGTGEYVDCVPLIGVNYHYWVQTVGRPEEPSVTGTVRDQDGNPLGEVLLHLYNADKSTDIYTVSLSDGSYAFYDVPPGTYFLVAKRDNYTIFSTTVTVL